MYFFSFWNFSKNVSRIILIFFPVICNSQGIVFDERSSWQNILQQAKASNKYIFIDCYTTWCGPCKEMDNEVYTDGSVGDFMNKKFISVKLQMDTAAGDNESTKEKISTFE